MKCVWCARFRKECKAAGKQLIVWTVNAPEQMMEVVVIAEKLESVLMKVTGCAMGSRCDYYRFYTCLV